MQQKPVLFVNHFHTHDSNRYMADVEDIWNYGNYNHAVDIVDFVQELPEEVDVVLNKTEHWKCSGKAFDDLELEVEEAGGSFERFERHVCFEISGRRVAVINSVEASVERSNKHFLICGLSIDDERKFVDIDFEELMKYAEQSSWTMPAHPFAPKYKLSDSMIRRFYEQADERGIETAIGYTTGYTPLFNRMTHGNLGRLHDFANGILELNMEELFGSLNPFKNDFETVKGISEEFGVPIISEMDIHSAVPEMLNGIGIMDSEAMDELFSGRIPVDRIFDSDVVIFEDAKNGLSWFDFFRSFPGILPLYNTKIYKPFLPYEKEEFVEIREESMSSVKDVSAEDFIENRKDSSEIL